MSKKWIDILPGQAPDGRIFVLPGPFAQQATAGFFRQQDESCGTHPLAEEICEIAGVAGVKVEDREMLVVVHDPSDWDAVQARVLAILGDALKPAEQEEPKAPGLVRRDPQIYGFGSCMIMVFHPSDESRRIFHSSVKLAGSVEVLGTFGPGQEGYAPASPLCTKLYCVPGVTGVNLVGHRVEIRINGDNDTWHCIQWRILELLLEHTTETDERRDDPSVLPLNKATFSPSYSSGWATVVIPQDNKDSHMPERPREAYRVKILQQMRKDEEAAGVGTTLPEPTLTVPWPAESAGRTLEVPPLERERSGRHEIFVGRSVVMF